MSFTFVDSDGANGAGSSNTIASPGLTVSAGDLVVVVVKFEGATTTVSVSDGTSSLTPWVVGVKGAPSGEPWLDVFYILSSVANGTNTVVYTATLGAARTFRDIVVMSYTPSASCSLDGTAVAASGDSAPSNPSSGNMTTTGTDGVAFGCFAEFGNGLSVETINGVAFDHRQVSGSTKSELFSKTYSAGFTGAASAVMGSNRWDLGIIAFLIGTAAKPTGPFVTSRPDLP